MAEWWNALPTVNETPFVHTRVLEGWGKAFIKQGEKVETHVLKRRGEPVAAIPLIRRPGRRYSLSADQVDPADVVSILDEDVNERIPEWLDRLPVVHLHCFREQSPLVQALDDHPRWVLRLKWDSPYLDLSQGVMAARSNLGAKSQSTLRRRWRRLHEMGAVTFVDHSSPAEVQNTLEAGLRLEAAGWKSREGRAVLKTPEYEAFYRSLAEVAQDHGWLRLSTLYLDDRMLAFHLNLVYGGRRYLMLTTFDEDEEFSKLSLGNLLLDAVIERSCDEQLSSYEFGRGWNTWKERWTPTARPIYNFSIYGSGIRGRVMSARHKRRTRETSAST
jgi:hypothetical protein